MSDQPTSDLQPQTSVPGLWKILQDLEDGTLSEDQRNSLMEDLESSPVIRQAYLEYFQQSAVFRMEGAKMHELGLLPVVDLSNHSSRLFKRSLVAAAALILVCAILATLIAIKREAPGTLNVAVVADTEWSVDGNPQSPDARKLTVTQGSTVNVLSGTVELRLESGATIVLQGPAEATFPELHQPILKHGWLWVDSGDTTLPFEVLTPYLTIRDIGTRFGVRVPETGSVEVHLIEGQLVIEPREGRKTITTLNPGNEGVIIPPEGKPIGMTLAYDPFPDLPDLLAAKANYRTTLMSQSPIGYWRFETGQGEKLLNEVLQGSQADYGVEVAMGTPGGGPADDFYGFGDDNQSAQLLGDIEKSALVDLGGPDGVSRREGAVSFWIRRLPGLKASEALWLAGEAALGDSMPETSMMHTLLTESGRVQFFIENGKFDVTLASSRDLANGRWHHIVANWGPTAVELFVDGKKVASDEDSRSLADATFSGRNVRFGKPSRDLRQRNVQPFTGWVDEMAFWNRPLSDTEVIRQYQAALGNPER